MKNQHPAGDFLPPCETAPKNEKATASHPSEPPINAPKLQQVQPIPPTAAVAATPAPSVTSSANSASVPTATPSAESAAAISAPLAEADGAPCPASATPPATDGTAPSAAPTSAPCEKSSAVSSAAPSFISPPIAPSEKSSTASSAAPSTFVCDLRDSLFSLLFFGVGFCYIYVFTADFSGYPNLFLFTLVYLGTVLGYALCRSVRPSHQSWFWFGVTLLLGLSVRVMPISGSFGIFRFYFLTTSAVYWTLSIFGVLTEGKTGNFLPIDLLRGFLILPFGNFFARIRCFFRGLFRKGKRRLNGDVLIGILLTLPLLWFFVLPLLARADSGFDELLALFFSGFSINLSNRLMLFLLRSLLALPVSAYLFGLCYGAAHRRYSAVPSRETLQACGKEFRFLPPATVDTILAILCAVYLVFILLQASYLFSGFAGLRPSGFTFAQYARKGFFELCQLTCINLFFLFCASKLSRAPDSSRLRLFSALLSTLTLCLIATALSKMFLYISAYGLTPKRVITSLFMLWLAVVFLLLLLHQRKALPFVRVALLVFTVGFVLLCFLDLEALLNHYNLACGFDIIAFDSFYY